MRITGGVLAAVALLGQGCSDDQIGLGWLFLTGMAKEAPATLIIDGPGEEEVVEPSVVRVQGRTAWPGAEVSWSCGGLVGRCRAGTEAVDGGGLYPWSFEVVLPPGTHAAEVRATALDGSWDTRSVAFHRVAP